MRWFRTFILAMFSLGFIAAIGGVGAFAYVIYHFGQDLPEHAQLADYEPSIITRIYAGDGGLLAEYAQEKRIFVPVQKIPNRVKQAFISAEDKNFYTHNGIDLKAVARAIVMNIKNYKSNRRLVGASTITQQVAKNFLLTNEVSYERKIKEAILALRMEEALSKEQLLELYLNEIFLGQRSYGVAAAALTYFDKSLDELTVEEAAYLAALPKAPNNYHPTRHYEAAVTRRNWVIGRMRADGHVTKGEAELAQAKPLTTQKRDFAQSIEADFFTEEVRRELKDKYGSKSLYEGGLAVRSSIDPALQNIAVRSLREGLTAYDHRHGWRGSVANFSTLEDWNKRLSKIATPEGMLDEWQLGAVLAVDNASATIGFADKQKVSMTLDSVKWARKCLQDCYALGVPVTGVSQVLNVGDVIMVAQETITEATAQKNIWMLKQVPKVQGAIIALDPHTGRVLAMQGGWTQSASSYNRATQAKRQPGSAFKPFVYLAALESGFTPSTKVLDGPFVVEQAPGDFWRPSNYSNKYYGPSTLRMGIEKSRNLMTVRLADKVGMEKVVDYATRFGIADEMKNFLSYSLGAGETTLLRMTSAYGMLVNGGKKITPTFIDRIQNREGATVFSYDQRPCINCGAGIRWEGQAVPTVPDTREQIADEKMAYQIVSILEGVVERGTARRLKEIGRPLAGKTGTTNKSKDTWFIGFSPDLVVGVFVGFDQPKSLGKRETGSSVAAPIFGDFMEQALKDTPPMPFRVPPGIKNVRVNAKTGRLAGAGDENVIWEAFLAGTEPGSGNFADHADMIADDGSLIKYYAAEDMFDYDDNLDYGENFVDDIYGDGSVETYTDNNNEDNSLSYFSNRRKQGAEAGQDNTERQRDNERVQFPPSGIYEANQDQRPQPIQRAPERRVSKPPAEDNSAFTGTGGIY